MDHFKYPVPLSTARRPSATFPLTHGSPPVPRPNGPPEEPLAAEAALTDRRSSRRHHPYGAEEPTSPDVPATDDRRHSRRRHIDPSLDGAKSHHRHKHSKSRELRLPRPMSHLASSASARGLLPTWSGSREKDREGEDGLLRPITHETTRSRWGSDSTGPLGTGSRKGSLLDTPEQHGRLGPIQRQEIQSMEDLERVKNRRKQGEE